MRLFLLGLLPVLCLLGGCGSKNDKDLIQGTWTVISFEADGKPQKELENSQFTFTNEALTLKQADRGEVGTTTKDGKMSKTHQPGEEMTGTFRLDPAKHPKEIDLVMQRKGREDRKSLGLYTLEGDALKIAIAKDETRPTGFGGPGVAVITLKRGK